MNPIDAIRKAAEAYDFELKESCALEALPQVKALVDAVKYVRAPGWLLTREGIKKLEAAIQPFL